MALSPDHLPMDSTTEQWTLDCHLLSVQVAMINQITQVIGGKLVLDEVLHAIALQLHDTLQVGGCLIFKALQCQPMAGAWVSLATAQKDSKQLSQERFQSVCGEFYQNYHSWLAQGKPVIIPGGEQQLPAALQDLAEECGLRTVLIVPILCRQCFMGCITLYNRENRPEWTQEEIVFVQSIADYCAIALYQSDLTQHYQTEFKKRQESESALKESQKRLHSICNQTSQLLGLLTPEGTVLEVNQAVLDFAGLQAQDILGRPFWEAQWWLPSIEAIGKLQEAIAAAGAGKFIRYEVNVLGKSVGEAPSLAKRGEARWDAIASEELHPMTLEVSFKPLRDETKQVVLLIFEGRDITDYKQLQSALATSEARNSALLQAIPDFIARVSRDGIYLDCKAAKEDVLPIRTTEIIGKHLHQTLPTEVAGQIWHHIELALETNEIQSIEYQLWLKGKSRDFEARLVKSGSDEVAVIVQDITERVQARVLLQQVNDALEIRVAERTAALKEANHVLRAEIVERKKAEKEVNFLHSVTQAMFESYDFHEALSVALQKVCEATGWDFGEAWVPNANGSILECSPAWFSKSERLEPFRRASEALTFAPGSGLPGRVWLSKRPEWRRDVSAESNNIYRRAQLAREVGLKAGLGIPLLTPNGVLAVLVFYMFKSQDEDERLIELISASTALGLMIQRKQAEGEIRKALTREKELTELKSRFISMTSHEFRTPLTTIQSSAELLEHYSHKWTDERKLTHLHRIQGAVIHMTKLLNDVLILGKAEAGKLEFNPAPLDLENYCRNLVEELQLNDSNKHIITFTCSQRPEDFREWESGKVGEVSVNPESSQSPPHLLTKAPVTPSPERSGSPPLPCMDEKLLRQILENLLSNAIKYSPSGGNVELTLSDFSNQAVFQIRDHGIGIPAEDQQQLFETFHRATNVGTIAGTGLGLAIVKRCVDIHQGQITVESEVGVGTTFTVTLPIYNSLVP